MSLSGGCNPFDHPISRRLFLGGMALGGLARPTVAGELRAAQKRVLLVFQHGGLSQLESWDPKPHTEFGGPFGTIPTSLPGVRVSELMPHTARQLHRLVV